MEDLNQLFIDKYRTFESWVANNNFGSVTQLVTPVKENDFKPPLHIFKNEVDTIRNLRNVLTHVDVDGDETGRKMITVNQAMIDFEQRTFDRIMKSVLGFAIQPQDIYSCKKEDNVLSAIKKMDEMNYTHIPIIDEKNRVLGVFSENTLFNMVVSFGEVKIDKDTRFSDIWSYISTPEEKKKIYGFFPSDKTYAECVMRFNRKLGENQRLDILFITKDGTPQTEMQGLITTWDISARGL